MCNSEEKMEYKYVEREWFLKSLQKTGKKWKKGKKVIITIT